MIEQTKASPEKTRRYYLSAETDEKPLAQDQNEEGKNDCLNENDRGVPQDLSRASAGPTSRTFNPLNPSNNRDQEGEALNSSGSAIGSISVKVPEEKPELEKRVVSIKQKESFFNDKTCRVIFIEDIIEEKKMGQKEMALQVQDHIADTVAQKMSLPLSLIMEAVN